MFIDVVDYIRLIRQWSQRSTCARDCYGHHPQECVDHMAKVNFARAELKRIEKLFDSEVSTVKKFLRLFM